ncbi:MAG: hypothetical protein C0624_11940 [Desulfuromonas sp.]|nr:MAG: hypothetical protein C0624_11940 [Desulfuromonas sp.]
MPSCLNAGLVRRHQPGSILYIFLVLSLLLSGCAGSLNKSAKMFYSGNYDQALEVLDDEDSVGGKSRLLRLMERGVILHRLGNYRESNAELLAAARLIEEFETISASEQLSSMVTSEWVTSYKGEFSERLWVHSYLMMNFLLLGEFDGAQVEARQCLKLLDAYPEVFKSAYYTRALMALSFSVVAEDNDAFLVYRKLSEDLPSPQPVAADLVRLAGRLGQRDEVERFQSQLPKPLPSGEGELVLFVAAGRLPEKKPGNVVLPPSIRFSFPYYTSRRSTPLKITLLPPTPTLPLISTDLAEVAVNALDERKTQILAKETARVVGKEVIAQSVGNSFGDAAEILTRLSLLLLEEPDTRSWKTLPARLTLVRVPLQAGHYELTARISTLQGFNARELEIPPFELRAGQRVFRSIRY